MKKRLLAVLLCLCMAATFLPGTAWAAEPVDITETGLVIWAERNGSDGPTSSATYKAGGGTAEWDLANLTLTLTNATINATNAQYGNALEFPITSNYPEVTIVLNGTNIITGKDYDNSHGIYCNLPLRISGSGTLTATGGTASAGESIGIDCFGLTVEQGATVNAVGGSGSYGSYGVSSSAEVTVAGTLNATAESGMGMLVNRGLIVEDGGVLESRGCLTYSTKSYGINFNGSNMPVTVNGTLIAIGFAPFGNKEAIYQNEVIIKGSASANGTDLISYESNPASFPCTSTSNNLKYIIMVPQETSVGSHTHNGGDTWKSDETNHWHECTAEGCDLTGTPKKYDSAAHVYTDDADTICNVCGYEREVTTEPEAPAISNISYNYSTGALTWTGKNIPVTDHTNGYFWIQTFDSEGNEVDGSGRECMETNVHEAGIQVTKSGDTYSCTYKPVTLADGNYKIRIECRVPGGSTVSYSFTLPQSTTPDTPSTPSGGGSSSSNTTTETTKNPDGSTTTKTENKTTGTVTETTKNTDGSTTKVETKKDGTVTTTQTDATGNKTETVAKPDGSSVTKVNQKDGTKATVNTDTEGKVEAEVTLPKQAVAAAQENEQPIMLPVPRVEAAASAETAPVVTVKTGSDEPVKVLIPTTEAKPGTVAVIVKENGTEEIVKTSVSTADGLAVSLPDGATVKIVDNSKTFADVPASNWAADAVSFSTARELFSGTSEDSFSPDEPMTHAMMVTVLARFDGADTSGGDTWYEKSAQWAADKGISDGSDLGSNISREQLAVMLWRYAGSPAPTGGLEDFHDAGSVSDYAQEAMRWAVESGIVNGNGSGALLPQGEATRAQVAQMLKNFIEMQ